VDPKEYVAKGRFPIANTPELRFLDKAATKDGSISRWKLCPVTQVEETKLMIRMLPVWVAMFMPSTLSAHAGTLFIKQATTLNRHMGPHFQIPAGNLTSFAVLLMLVTIVLYDRVLVRILRRFTGNPRGITMLQRIAIGMTLHVLTMAVASIADMKRISVVKEQGIQGNGKAVAPLTVFILLPQFLLGGIAEGFLEAGKLEFFYDQAPESMQSVGGALYASTIGIGSFLTSFLLNVSNEFSGRKGHTSWILNNLNASRVYYYYAFVTVLSFLNLIFFVVVSRFYAYKRETNEAFSSHSHGHAGAVTTTEDCDVLPLHIKVPANEMEMVKVN
jgi:peptide/histidine transporter 3/4